MRLPKENPPRLPGETAYYEDDPFELGELDDAKFVLVEDFLPRPEELIFKAENTVKISMILDKESVDFFKAEAARLRVPYQRMIRNLLQIYTQHMKQVERDKQTA